MTKDYFKIAMAENSGFFKPWDYQGKDKTVCKRRTRRKLKQQDLRSHD